MSNETLYAKIRLRGVTSAVILGAMLVAIIAGQMDVAGYLALADAVYCSIAFGLSSVYTAKYKVRNLIWNGLCALIGLGLLAGVPVATVAAVAHGVYFVGGLLLGQALLFAATRFAETARAIENPEAGDRLRNGVHAYREAGIARLWAKGYLTDQAVGASLADQS